MVMSGSLGNLQQRDCERMIHSASTNSLPSLTSTAVIASISSVKEAHGDGIDQNTNGAGQSLPLASDSNMDSRLSSSNVDGVTNLDGANTTIITIGMETSNRIRGKNIYCWGIKHIKKC